MFLLSPFVKGRRERIATAFPFDDSSTVKTIQEIFDAKPLLGAAAYERSFARLGMVSDASKGD
jgi:hypothetical protein